MKVLLFRIGILLLGIPLLFSMFFSVRDLLLEQIKKRTLWRQDAIVVIVLFCLANTLGTLYVFFIQATAQLGLFYKSTTIAPAKLNIFFGPLNPYGIIFGLVIVIFYAICRQGMGRALSVLCALMFMVSSNHLHNLIPSMLRDYARAPFVLSEILIMTILAVSPFKKGKIIVLSAFAGVIVGVGLWVREDMIMLFFPFVLLIFFFVPGHLLANLKTKIAACIIFIMFSLALMPVSLLPSSRRAINVLGGQSSSFDARMGVTNSVYDWGYQYSDEFPGDLPYAQASVINPNKYFSSTPKEFDRAGTEYLTRVFCLFPADLLARAFATTLKIVELPFIYTEPPRGISNAYINAFYAFRADILGRLAGFGLPFVVLALIMVSITSFRRAIFCLFLLLYFTGYPSLEFQGRHNFHLEFVGWWCFGFVVQHGLFNSMRLMQNNLKDWRFYFKRVLAFAIIALLIILGPLFVFRQYQVWRLTDIINKCNTSNLQRLPVIWKPLDNGMVLITDPAKFKPSKKRTISGDYLVAEFDAGNSQFPTLWPILSYDRVPFSGGMDFSRTITINLEKGTNRLFFPVIYDNIGAYSITFKGIKMSREQAHCFRGLYRVKSPSNLPVLLTIKYPLYKGYESLYRKVNGWELPAVHAVPIALSQHSLEKIFSQQVIPVKDNDLIVKSNNVSLVLDKWVIKGYVQQQKDPYDHPLLGRKLSIISSTFFAYPSLGLVDTDLIRTKGVWLKKGSCFVARGELRTGGVTFGLIRNKQNSGYVCVADRGPFTIVIEAPVDGTYSLGVANYLDVYTSLENRLVIKTMGWVKLK